MSFGMHGYGKSCRSVLVVSVFGLFTVAASAIEIRVSNPFTGPSSIFSRSPSDTAAPPESSGEASFSRQKGPHGGRAENYLQAARSMEVAYAATSPGRERGASASTSAAPSFSDFMERLEKEADDEDEGGGKGSTVGEQAGNGETSDAAALTADGGEGSDAGGKREATGGDSGGVVDAGEAVGPPVGGEPSRRMDGAGGRLFQRQQAQEEDLSEIFLFFPSNEFDADKQGNYEIITPLDRFDFFTPPSALLPRSTARYRSVP